MNRAGAFNQAANGGFTDVFLMLFNSSYTQIWGTFLGGPGTQENPTIAFDASSNIFYSAETAWMSGSTAINEDLVNPGGGAYYQATNSGEDIMFGKFTSAGALVWNTLYGGNGDDGLDDEMGNGTRVIVSPANELFVIGGTSSTNLPLLSLAGAYNQTCPANVNSGGSYDDFASFILRFTNAGVRLWATYWGENLATAWALLYDGQFTSCNKFVVAARANYTTMPLAGHYNKASGGQSYLMQFNNAFAAEWSSYVGNNTSSPKITFTPFGNRLYLSTQTYSTTETTVNPGGGAYFDGVFAGPHYAAYSIWEFNIVPPPSLSGSFPICAGTSTTITASGGIGGTYEWYTTSSGGSPFYTGSSYTTPVLYADVTYWVSAASGSCISERIPVTVTVSAAPSVTASASLTTVCLAQSTTLTGGGASSYNWNNGLGAGQTHVVAPASTTTYTVTGTGGTGCTNTASVTVSVTTPSSAGLINGDYVWWPRTSNDWGVTTNWLVYNGSVFQIPAGPPTSTNNVFILTDVGCVATWPTIFAAAYCRSLTIGTGAQLTISASNTLDVYGNWTNSGSFFCNTSRVNFLGAVNATITGTTTFYDLVMNKGTGTTYLLNVNSPITVSHNAITALGFTNGLMTVNAGGSLTLAAGQTISSTAGLHFNGGNLVAGNYSLTNQGYFRISSGTVNLGNSTGNSFNAQNGSTNIISGGAFNIAARMAFTGTASLTVSGGTINLCQVENTSATATWHMDANASLNMSSGSLLLNQPAIGTGYDVNLLAGAGAKSISGGSVQFGVAATALSAAFRVSNPATPFFNLIVFRCGILTLMSPVSANAVVTFTNGHVVSSAVNYFNFNDGASWSGASNSSFVNGPVRKTGDDAFVFPTGDVQGASNVFARLAIADPGSTVTDAFTAEYFFLPSPNNWDPAFLCTGVHHASGIEYWNIERNAGTTYPAVTLYWDNGTRSGITSLADLTVVHMENCGGTNKWVDKGGSTTGTTAAGTITSTLAFPSYSPVTFGSKTGTNPLPVSLTSFYAQCQDQRVTLYWTTLSETNSDYFEVLCSTDGDSWTPLGRLTAAGYSNEPRFYSYTDPLLRESLHHYRLIQADFDGTHYEIPAIAVNCYGGSPADIIVYPNPFNGWVSIIIPENMILINWSLTDVAGKLVDAGIPAEGNGIHTLNIPGLSRGVYFLSLTTGSEVKRFKLVRE